MIFGRHSKLSRNIARFAPPRAGIPRYYQVHTGIRDYEIPDSRARVVPFVEFVKELAV